MKILIVGNGGREHALLWKLRRDAPAAEFFITRGNGGTHALARALPLAPDEIPAIAAWAEANAIDLAVIGPEGPLAAGVVDALLARGVPAFGPTREAAAIEASKVYAKKLLERAGVPTAEFRTFSEPHAAADYIRRQGGPLVVKASGLAAGKGAVVCETTEEALAAARAMLLDRAFGEAGHEIVVEQVMAGEELSIFGITDGETVLTMLPAQDHKRVGEGDTGPNTGGMGAYAPVSLATPALIDEIRTRVFAPTIEALREEERRFRGLLYAGLMLTDEGPKVIEFNCRFGDPETQVVVPLLRSSLLEPLLAVARGDSIAGHRLEWHDGAALTTVLAAGGYPGAYDTGEPIELPQDVESDDVLVFHAGTRREDGRLLTAGGRVLAVTGRGPTLDVAATRSRAAAARIRFSGRHYRRDIGHRELARARAS